MRIKRKITILLFCLLFIGISTFSNATQIEAIESKLVSEGQGGPVDKTNAVIRSSNLNGTKPFPKTRLISHAMGEIEGHYYTNSLEAFQNSYYSKGSRVFEVDLELTLEGILVARHDWRLTYAKQLLQTPQTPIENRPWTYDYFMKQSINKKYTPLDINGIIELLIIYPDISIVTDTKHLDLASIKKQFSQIIKSANYDPAILNRIIPQIYNQEMLTSVNNIYKFENIIYTLYSSPDNNEQVLNFVKDNVKQIKAVTIPTSRVNRNFIDKLHNLNVYVFTHPIWNIEKLIYFYEMGVDGFYSATISKQEMDGIVPLFL
jgi:glycerophosphoryl diester phosphodiesterase